MDTLNAYDEAQTRARVAIRQNLDGLASEADIADAAKLVVDTFRSGQSTVVNVRDARNAITEAMGTDVAVRGLRPLKHAVESVSLYLGRADLAQERRDRAWQVIAEVRDRAERVPGDASTDDIVQALIDAGIVRT